MQTVSTRWVFKMDSMVTCSVLTPHQCLSTALKLLVRDALLAPFWDKLCLEPLPKRHRARSAAAAG